MEQLKAMPKNNQAEQELIGAVLSTPDTLTDLIGFIVPDDFYNNAHKIIYGAVEDLFTNNEKVDIITVSEKLKNFLDEIGGLTYLSKLAGSSVGRNVKSYAEIIKEKSNKRKLILTARKLLDDCYRDEELCKNLVGKVEEELFKVNLTKENRLESFNKVLENTINHIEDICNSNGSITGIDTGFTDINKVTGGLQRKDLIILAARPSMGKTTLAVNIASNVAKNNTVAVFSLEMSNEQLARKIISSRTHIDLARINTGNLDEKDWQRIGVASGPLAQSKMFIDDTAGISVNEIKARCKKIKLQHGLDVVIIDYLQLITEKAHSREQEISKISRALKQLAKDLNVTVIALSQLSRACETRPNHRPMLSDLRESGSIEQDADIVMFLYRDEYYDEESEDKNIAECIFAKNRNGKVGTVKLAWLGQFQKFGNLDYMRN